MNKKELKNNDLLKNNPLIQHDFKVIVNAITDNKTFHKDTEGILLHKQFYFERERYTKIYLNPIHRKLIALISNNAKCLLYWIMFEIEQNQDHVLINKNRYLLENNIKSIKTLKNALTELQANLIICQSPVKDVFFINPRLFYSGNRIKQFPQHIQVYVPNKNK